VPSRIIRATESEEQASAVVVRHAHHPEFKSKSGQWCTASIRTANIGSSATGEEKCKLLPTPHVSP
jgi:hypothetical protein